MKKKSQCRLNNRDAPSVSGGHPGPYHSDLRFYTSVGVAGAAELKVSVLFGPSLAWCCAASALGWCFEVFMCAPGVYDSSAGITASIKKDNTDLVSRVTSLNSIHDKSNQLKWQTLLVFLFTNDSYTMWKKQRKDGALRSDVALEREKDFDHVWAIYCCQSVEFRFFPHIYQWFVWKCKMSSMNDFFLHLQKTIEWFKLPLGDFSHFVNTFLYLRYITVYHLLHMGSAPHPHTLKKRTWWYSLQVST